MKSNMHWTENSLANIMGRRNKNRLYIALYYHKRQGEYHWALFASPKSDADGTIRYHATNKLLQRDAILKPTWIFESLPLGEVKEAKLLAKVLIGKIRCSREEFEASLRRVAIEQDNPTWTCRTWIRNSISQLAQDGIMSDSSITDWEYIEAESRSYARRKKDEGRFNTLTTTTPTYDLLSKREVET